MVSTTITQLLSKLLAGANMYRYKDVAEILRLFLRAAGFDGEGCAGYRPDETAAVREFFTKLMYPHAKDIRYSKLDEAAQQALERSAHEWLAVITVAASGKVASMTRYADQKCSLLRNACQDFLNNPPSSPFIQAVPNAKNPAAKNIVVHLGGRQD